MDLRAKRRRRGEEKAAEGRGVAEAGSRRRDLKPTMSPSMREEVFVCNLFNNFWRSDYTVVTAVVLLIGLFVGSGTTSSVPLLLVLLIFPPRTALAAAAVVGVELRFRFQGRC